MIKKVLKSGRLCECASQSQMTVRYSKNLDVDSLEQFGHVWVQVNNCGVNLIWFCPAELQLVVWTHADDSWMSVPLYLIIVQVQLPLQMAKNLWPHINHFCTLTIFQQLLSLATFFYYHPSLYPLHCANWFLFPFVLISQCSTKLFIHFLSSLACFTHLWNSIYCWPLI